MDQNVTITEATITFVAFIILLITCYAADRMKARSQKAKDEKEGDDSQVLFQYQAVDFYRTLLKEREDGTPGDTQKAQEMKGFLKKEFGHDQIEKVQLDELKKKVEGDGMLAKAKYRRQVQ